MAITEPPAPMTKPAARKTSKIQWDMLEKGRVLIMPSRSLWSMALTMMP